jgi:hypothetical protein
MRSQRYAAEALGTALLLATVIGPASWASGWRRQCRPGLARQHARHRAMLVVLIGMFGPISGPTSIPP